MADPAQKSSQQQNVVSFKPNSSKDSQNSERSGYSNLLMEELQARIVRLTGQLDDEERKRRNQDDEFTAKKRELEDEISKLKRELAEDNTEEKLSHEREINQLKETHRDEVQQLKDEIRDLKQEITIKKIQAEIGGKRGVGDRVMDMIEENGGEFIANLISGINQMAQKQGVPPQQLSGDQFNQAFNQAQKQTHHQPADARQPESSIQNPESRGQHTDPSIQNPSPSNHQPEPNIPKITSEEMPQAQKTVQDYLLDAAVAALTNQNTDLKAYSHQIRNQLHIFKEQGVQLDVKHWTELAKSVAETAVDKNISEERVAEVISPALDGIKNYSFMLKAADPDSVTELLFNQFNIQANPTVRKLVGRVLKVLKENL